MAQSSIIFAGSSHGELALKVAEHLNLRLGKLQIETFPDGEIGVQVLENVRGRDAFVLQSPASINSITVVLPYFAYARQDRKDKGRMPITARLVADLLEKAGITRLLTVDLHTEQIQGFFNIPVDNLYARPLFVDALKQHGLEKVDRKSVV